jgi:hypothetical protein
MKEVLGSGHQCFLVHEVVERLDLKRLVDADGEEGGVRDHPSLRWKVWLYA